MTVRTSDVLRLSTARCKLEVGPTKWRTAATVHFAADGYEADVELVRIPCTTTGQRTFMRCPRCGNDRVTTIGLVEGSGWSCRSCARWRGARKRQADEAAVTHELPPGSPKPAAEGRAPSS